MDQFQCSECGMISTDQSKVTDHMYKAHNIKTNDEITAIKFFCPSCIFVTSKMDELRNHIMKDHNKEKHNWMVQEIKAAFSCDECTLEFPRRSLLENHIENVHDGDKGFILEKDAELKNNENKQETSENTEDESSEDAEVEPNTKVEEFEDYTKTTHNEDEPNLIILKGTSTDFLEARRRIAKIVKTSSLQKKYLVINKTRFKTTNLQSKPYSLEADIETTDENNQKGKSKLTIYKDNKKKVGKKEQTIMISKKAKNNAKHVEVLSNNIIQFLLESFIKKDFKIKEIVKEEVSNKASDHKCDVCENQFTTKQGLSNHKARTHDKVISEVQKKLPCSDCGEVKSTLKILKAHTELKHKVNRLKRTLSVMKESKEYVCTDCKLRFKQKADFDSHMITHSTSPPTKKLKNEQIMNNVNPVQKEVEVVAEEEMTPADSNVVDNNEVKLVEEVEMVPDEKQIAQKGLLDNKVTDDDNFEIEQCYKVLSETHICMESEYKLRYETMRSLKEEKNKDLEKMRNLVEEIKLKNATLNFVVGTMDNPNIVTELFEENSRLNKVVLQANDLLARRKHEIERLRESPEKFHQIWATKKPVGGEENNDLQNKEGKNPDPPTTKLVLEKDDLLDTNGEIDMADLQRLADLKLSGHRREDPQSSPSILTKTQSQQSPSPKRHVCNKCDSNHNSSEELEEHIDTHYEDGDFSCDTCLFQSNKMKLLRNHILNSPGHSSGQVRGKKAIKCKFFEEKFLDKQELIKHKNIKHKTYKTCDYFKEDKCKRNPCRFSHKIIKEGNCVCFHCGKEISEKSDMYTHRKNDHKSEICKNFLKNNCDREEDECWFRHVKHVENVTVRKQQVQNISENSPTENTSPQGFWKSPRNPVPPAIDMEMLLKSIDQRVQLTMEKLLKEIKANA